MMRSSRSRLLFAAVAVSAVVGTAWWLLLAGGDAPDGEPECVEHRQECRDSCEGGDFMSCWRLGEAFYYAGEHQNHAEALQAYANACELGRDERPRTVERPDPVGSSCFLAGVIWSGQHGHPPDRAKAWAYYHEACTHRFGHACHALGEMYERGDGAPRDEVEAHRYYALGCGYGSEHACNAANRIAP